MQRFLVFILHSISYLLGFVVWNLSLILENSWPLLFHVFLFILFLETHFCVYHTFWDCLQSSWIFCYIFFIIFFSLCFQFEEILSINRQVHWFCSCLHPVYSWAHPRHSAFLLDFLICSFFLILRDSIFFAYIFLCLTCCLLLLLEH